MDSNWWLVVIGALTAIVSGWQSWETKQAAKATRDSVQEINAQTGILMDSVDAARDSAMAAKMSPDALLNSERAWILAHLKRVPEYAGPLQVAQEADIWKTYLRLKLVCHNQGRSPAWINGIFVRLNIVPLKSSPVNYQVEDCDPHGRIEPIGSGAIAETVLIMNCDGIKEFGSIYDIFVLIQYQDIFGLARETTRGYNLTDSLQLVHQLGIPDCNRNT